MKMQQAHLQYMKDKISPLDTPTARAKYIAGDFPNAAATKDLNKRYRWDLFWAAGLARFAVDVLYKYCSDDRIDTALKSFVKPLE